MLNGGNGAVRQRINFSKIPTVIKIPNLIEVQRRSYERFLQMNLLPSEREDAGLQAVFNSVFPITDFRGIAQLDFVDYSIGNWECKCGSLKGLHHLRSTCKNCGHTVITDPFKVGDVLCTRCGTFNKNVVTFCNKCGDPVALQLKYDVTECQERGMTFAAPSQGHHPAHPLRQGQRHRPQEYSGYQGTRGLFRRNPLDDRERHLHHQRDGTRHREPASSFSGRFL